MEVVFLEQYWYQHNSKQMLYLKELERRLLHVTLHNNVEALNLPVEDSSVTLWSDAASLAMVVYDLQEYIFFMIGISDFGDSAFTLPILDVIVAPDLLWIV